MCVVINYYNNDNKIEYTISEFGNDGLYIKAIKNNYYIFYKKRYISKLNVKDEMVYNLLNNLYVISDKFKVFNDNKYLRLLNRLLKWISYKYTY